MKWIRKLYESWKFLFWDGDLVIRCLGIFLTGAVLAAFILIGLAISSKIHESAQAKVCEAKGGEWGVIGWHWGYEMQGRTSEWTTIDDMGCRPYEAPK